MKPEMTIVLLNYQRPENIPIILDSIRRQTSRPVVYLWNNGTSRVDLCGVDRYGKSGRNVGCMVRWKLVRSAETPFVMSLDDDLCFARDDALDDVIQSLREMDHPARIIGPVGCSFGDNPSYQERQDHYAGFARDGEGESAAIAFDDQSADMIKGRAMAFRRDRLRGLVLPDEREDDIFLSAALAGGQRRFHRVPARLHNAFRELPERGVGNWTSPEHFPSRDRAAAQYFGPSARQSMSYTEPSSVTERESR